MPRAEALERARAELNAGEACKAKDRLRGLLSTYPSDLEVRHALAAAYRALGDPIQAGRWGYLNSADADPAERAAFETWTRDARHRLRVLRWPIAPDEAATDEARATLRRVVAEANRESRRETIGCWAVFAGAGVLVIGAIIGVLAALRALL